MRFATIDAALVQHANLQDRLRPLQPLQPLLRLLLWLLLRSAAKTDRPLALKLSLLLLRHLQTDTHHSVRNHHAGTLALLAVQDAHEGKC